MEDTSIPMINWALGLAIVAAKAGNFEVLKWLVDHRWCWITNDVHLAAAEGGNLKLFKFIRGSSLFPGLSAGAARQTWPSTYSQVGM